MLQALSSSKAPSELLLLLKELKNSVIGNTARKVELAKEKGLASHLVTQLSLTTDLVRMALGKDNDVRLEILNELFVILGTLSNVGDQTLSALLSAQLPSTLLTSISELYSVAKRDNNPHSSYILHKLMPSALRALRNISIAAADVVLGKMWGVGVETKVITAGGDAMDVDSEDKGEGSSTENMVAQRWRQNDVRAMARNVVVGMFDPNSLITLVPIMTSTIPSQSRLPLYQMFAHLTMIPSHRQALASLNHPTYKPQPVKHPRTQAAESPLTTITLEQLATSLNPRPKDVTPGPLVAHLCRQVVGLGVDVQGNAKVTAASLELLAAMCRDETTTAIEAVAAFQALDRERETGFAMQLEPVESSAFLGGLIKIFIELLNSRTPGVPVAAANCLTNIAKALNVKGGTLTISSATELLPTLIRLLGPPSEDSIRVCFIIAHLTSDEEDIQRVACDTECLNKVMALAKAVDKDDPSKPMAENLKARTKEGCFLAMASLALIHEAPRAVIVDGGLLPIIHDSLSHPSYGVRAAACQVTRALSRSVAILRTSLVDSGIASKVLELLKEEEKRTNGAGHDPFSIAGRDEKDDTVLIAAAATLCNLITEFSPMQTMMIDEGGIELLVRLCNSASEPARTNAVWALKNMMYKNGMQVKQRVMNNLTWPGLKAQIQNASVDIQEQGLALMRNFVCDGNEEEVSALFEGMGEEDLFELLLPKLYPEAEVEPMEQALYVLYNIALGSDAHRDAILSRRPILQGLKKALVHDKPMIRIAAIGCLLNLIESNDRHRRPRQDVVNRLKPLMLEAQIRQHLSDPIFDVRDQAGKVLALMEAPGGNAR